MVESAVGGVLDPAFGAVEEAFRANFSDLGESGAAVAVWYDGRPVVSLHGGVADHLAGTPWTEDTVVTVFSMTKALTATCAHHLAERGGLDLDVPVTRWWPEFGAAGKDGITTRMLLSHRAGLPVVEGDFTLDQALAWDPMVEALAAQTPLWEPDSAHGYHLRTFGWLVGEVFRRAAGRTVGQYARAELTGPAAIDWWLGLPSGEDHRAARLIPPPPEHEALMASLGDLLLVRAAGTPSGLFHYDEMWNDPRLRAAELPSSTSVTNAAAAARFYAGFLWPLGGSLVLRPDTLREALRVRSSGPDRVLLVETTFGSGYMLPPTLPAAAGPGAFGHSGAGGSVGFADPDAGLTFAYTTTGLRFEAEHDPRSAALTQAVYDSVR